jgi:outer membrane protein TolC
MGGKIIAYNQITKYAKELAQSMNDLKLQDVIYKTDEAYWQVVSLVNKKKLADSYVSLLRKMDTDVQALIEEGVATQVDGMSVRVKLNQAEMAQTKVDNGLALSRMALAQLCGLPLEESLALADENIESLPESTSSSGSFSVEEAFINRQELKSLDYAVRIYKKKEKIALAEHLPSVALTANYLVTNPNSFNGFKNDFGGMFNVGVAVQVPISGWWEGTYKRNAARAETHIKQLELDDAKEKIELQVNQSVYKVNEAGKKLTASSRNKEKAEENLRHATIGFEEGVIPALNLMEAQTAWVEAQSDLIDAQIEVKLTDVYLSKALGRLSSTTNNK